MSERIWKIDLEHSSVEFSVAHMVIGKVVGFIKNFEGTIKSNGVEFDDAKVEVVLEAGSLDTNIEKRNEHLKSADFLEAEKYPHIRFVSTKFTRQGVGEAANERKFQVEGRLTIKNYTHPVVLDVVYKGMQKDPWGNLKVGFSAKTSFRRQLFGLTWDKPLENGALFIGHEVKIDINTEFLKG